MGGMARGAARPQGEGRRVGPGVDMSRPCEGCRAGFQHHKQPGECPIPMPWDPSVQGQGTRTGLPAARLGRAQAGFKAGTGGQGLPRKTPGTSSCAGAEQPQG